jgi:hypothetical protein
MDSNDRFELPSYETYVVSPETEGALLFDNHGSVPTEVWNTLTWDVVAEFVFDMSCLKNVEAAGEIIHSMLHTGVYHDYVMQSKNVMSSTKYALDTFYSESPWMQFWLTLLFIHFNKNADRIAAVNASAVYINLSDPSLEDCMCKKVIDDMSQTVDRVLFKLATSSLPSFADGDQIYIPLKVGTTPGLIVCRHAHTNV